MPNALRKIFIGALLVAGLFAGVFLVARFWGAPLIREVTQEISLSEVPPSPLAGVGEPAPPFSLRDQEDRTAELSEFIGTPLVITFWASWNAAAVDQVRILDEFLARNPDRLFEIITIASQEDRSVVMNFIRRGGYRMRVLLDEDGAVSERYRARHLPLTYFIDREGVIRAAVIGVESERMLVEKVEEILTDTH